jgi:hypothetical protein
LVPAVLRHRQSRGGAADYSPYCITGPLNPALPDGGGEQVCGLFDANPSVFGKIDNFVTLADHYGAQRQHWHGLDFTVNARLQNGLLLQGGLSTGSTMTDNCEVVARVDNPSTRFCHNEEPFLTQVKFLGSYTLPWAGIQVSGSFQNAPGPVITANYVATSASIRSSLGRDLSSGPSSSVTVNLIEPNTLFGERLNRLDLRLGKVFAIGGVRVMGAVDLYNALNANMVLTVNNAYGSAGAAWQRPLSILAPRLVKVSARLNF